MLSKYRAIVPHLHGEVHLRFGGERSVEVASIRECVRNNAEFPPHRSLFATGALGRVGRRKEAAANDHVSFDRAVNGRD